MTKQSPQTNGINAELGKSYVARVENLEAQIESERGQYMAKAKAIRSDIKDVITDAKADGIPKAALKAIVADRRLERRRKKIADGLDIDTGAAFEQLKEALGDYGSTPLGTAAVDQAERDMRPRFNQDGADAAAGAV